MPIAPSRRPAYLYETQPTYWLWLSAAASSVG